jgi:hypothetical protein
MIVFEIDPNTESGKMLKICQGILHTGAKFNERIQLGKKVEDHGLEVLSINSTNLGRSFLIYYLKIVRTAEVMLLHIRTCVDKPGLVLCIYLFIYLFIYLLYPDL